MASRNPLHVLESERDKETDMRFFTRKRSIISGVVAIVAVAAIAFGAYAYFTSSGSGSGNATVGTTSNIQITNDTPVAQLYPGGADVPVTVHLHNPGGGNEYVADVSGMVADNGGCLGSWFVVDTKHYNAEVNHGATNDTTTNIRMLDSGTDQSACENATLTINWSSN
jgi:hypothetical protein